MEGEPPAMEDIPDVSPETPATTEEPPAADKAMLASLPEDEIHIVVATARAKIQGKYNREALQNDPSHPLYSQFQNFEQFGLKDELVKGVVALGFRKPSGIQARALPTLTKTSEDVIVQSQSGTGKTATFVLTCLQKIDLKDPTCQALILSPSRELAIQTGGV